MRQLPAIRASPALNISFLGRRAHGQENSYTQPKAGISKFCLGVKQARLPVADPG